MFIIPLCSIIIFSLSRSREKKIEMTVFFFNFPDGKLYTVIFSYIPIYTKQRDIMGKRSWRGHCAEELLLRSAKL